MDAIVEGPNFEYSTESHEVRLFPSIHPSIHPSELDSLGHWGPASWTGLLMELWANLGGGLALMVSRARGRLGFDPMFRGWLVYSDGSDAQGGKPPSGIEAPTSPFQLFCEPGLIGRNLNPLNLPPWP